MSAASLRLLGTPALGAASGDVPFVPERRFQLLAYLAVQGNWVGRDHLVALLWPESDQGHARGSLRYALAQIRRLPWLAGFEARGDALRWEVDTDLRRFESALAASRHAAAVALYGGPLLTGFDADASEPFVAWLHAERRRVHGRWRDAAIATIAHDDGAVDRIALAAHLLRDDPLDEPVLQIYVRLLRAAGRVTEAHRIFQEFAQRLAEDLGIEPSAESLSLLQSITAGPAPAPRDAPAQSDTDDTFIGRGAERRDIAALLARADIRCVTLLGPGGIGKSRLARRVCDDVAPAFAGAVTFVPLEDVREPAGIAVRCAREMGLRLQGTAPALDQVIGRLHAQRALLVFDNFEHLAAGAPLLDELLARCPALKVLATSRVRLVLAQERTLALDGLPCPALEDDDRAGDFDAVRLFVQRARQARGAFDAQSQLADIAEICRQVDGMPLALELTAAWARLLTCRAIADEVRAGSELLRAEDPSRPARQASIEATFVRSWELLAPAERDALEKMSVFRGGFTRDAAREVTGASLPILGSLADKSLVRVEKDRFSLHPLVAQFAAARYARAPAGTGLADAHARYYCAFLARHDGVQGAAVRGAMQAIEPELENVHAAWDHAVARGTPPIWLYARPLERYFIVRGLCDAGQDLIRRAVHAAGDDDRAQAVIGSSLSSLAYFAGRFRKSEELARTALAASRRGGDHVGVMKCLNLLGSVANESGRAAEGETFLAEAVQTARDVGDRPGLSIFLLHLGNSLRYQGKVDRCLECLRECRAVSAEIGHADGEAAVLNLQANVLLDAGRLREALGALNDALAVIARGGLEQMKPTTMSNLAGVYLALGDTDKAQEIADRTERELAQRDPHIVQRWLPLTRARIFIRRGELESATRLVAAAAADAVRDSDEHSLLLCVVHWVELLAHQGRRTEAETALAAAAAVSAGDFEATRLIEDVALHGGLPVPPRPDPAPPASSTRPSMRASLDPIVAEILRFL